MFINRSAVPVRLKTGRKKGDRMESLFFEKHGPKPTQEEWEEMGKPKMYSKIYENDEVEAWDEYAYGGIRLTVNGRTEEGKDMIVNRGYLALGYYYTGGESQLYKRI
jgi:hypothetical protein